MTEFKVWQINVVTNAFQKIKNLESYYAKQAGLCTDYWCGEFLKFVAHLKKRQFSLLIEKLDLPGIELLSLQNYNSEFCKALENLKTKNKEEIYEYVNKLSVRELKMHFFLLNGEKSDNSLFKVFIDLEQDFLERIENKFMTSLFFKGNSALNN